MLGDLTAEGGDDRARGEGVREDEGVNQWPKVTPSLDVADERSVLIDQAPSKDFVAFAESCDRRFYERSAAYLGAGIGTSGPHESHVSRCCPFGELTTKTGSHARLNDECLSVGAREDLRKFVEGESDEARVRGASPARSMNDARRRESRTQADDRVVAPGDRKRDNG